MGDAEGKFDAVGVHDVLVLNEDGLRGLGTKVGGGVGVVIIGHGSELGGEHEVEGAGLGELAFLGAAGDAGGLELALEGIERISAEATFAGFAIDHGIGESSDVAGGGEDGLVGEDGAVHAEDVIAFLDVFSPPEVFEVALEFSAEGAVVPASVQAAVEFGGLEDEAFAFAQGNDFLHAGGVGLVFISHRFKMLVGRAARKQEESQSGKGFLGNPLARRQVRQDRLGK